MRRIKLSAKAFCLYAVLRESEPEILQNPKWG